MSPLNTLAAALPVSIKLIMACVEKGEESVMNAMFIDKFKHLLHIYFIPPTWTVNSLSWARDFQEISAKQQKVLEVLLLFLKAHTQYRRVLDEAFCKQEGPATDWGKVSYLRARIVRAHQSRVRISKVFDYSENTQH